MNRTSIVLALLIGMLVGIASTGAEPQKKDYLSEQEADKVRDAYTPGERIPLFIAFAEDRLTKFQYELMRPAKERNRAELLNSLMNAYSGCMDDAADQIDVAEEKQQDVHAGLKLMRTKGKEFLDILEKLDKDGAELDTYRDTLEDAIEATKDAISDANDAEKEMPAAPVRRKPS